MSRIKTYKIFESSKLELDRFKSEIDDYLSGLKDLNFDVEVNRLVSVREYVYICIINKHQSRPFLWKDIKNDINRYIEMSEFSLRAITYDDNKGHRLDTSYIDKINDDQVLIYIELYFK